MAAVVVLVVVDVVALIELYFWWCQTEVGKFGLTMSH